MPCGAILREALKFDVCAAIVLYDQSTEGQQAIRLTQVNPDIPQKGNGIFWRFFHWIDKSSFEVSADSFTTFRVSNTCYDFWKFLPGKVITSNDGIGHSHPSQEPCDLLPYYQL